MTSNNCSLYYCVTLHKTRKIESRGKLKDHFESFFCNFPGKEGAGSVILQLTQTSGLKEYKVNRS